MLYWVYEGYLSALHFLFFLVLLSQPWIEHFTHSSTSLFWTLHHKLYAYTHLNMTTTFTKHLNHTFTLFFQPANCTFMPGTFFVHISSFFWLLESHLDEGIQRSVFWKPRLFHYNFFRASASCWIWRDLASWVLWGRYLLSWQGILVLFCRVDPSGLQGWLC